MQHPFDQCTLPLLVQSNIKQISKELVILSARRNVAHKYIGN